MRSYSVLLLVAAATGCAGASVPTKDVSDTKAAMRAADEVGARQIPKGELHLKLAQDQLTLAEQYLKEDEEHLAREALSRAKNDAELALALAKEKHAVDAANEARQRVQQLQSAATGASVPPPANSN